MAEVAYVIDGQAVPFFIYDISNLVLAPPPSNSYDFSIKKWHVIEHNNKPWGSSHQLIRTLDNTRYLLGLNIGSAIQFHFFHKKEDKLNVLVFVFPGIFFLRRNTNFPNCCTITMTQTPTNSELNTHSTFSKFVEGY